MPYIGYQPKDQQFVSPCAIRISDCPTTMGTLGLGDLGCPLMCRHVTSLPKAIPPAGSLKKPHHSGRSAVRSFVSASHLFFPDLFSPPSGKPKEGGTALLQGALPSKASTPPAKACASEKAVLHHTPATTGHCWAPSLLTRISSELTAL